MLTLLGLVVDAMREHVFEFGGMFLDFVHDLSGDRSEKSVGCKARNRHNQTKSRSIESNGNVPSQQLGFIFSRRSVQRFEGFDQTKNGTQQTKHGGYVCDSCKVIGAFLDFGQNFQRRFFHGIGNGFMTFVGSGQTSLDHFG